MTVAIVGGGASGTLLATQLIRASRTVTVTIIDPAEELGRGVAYATACRRHVLNVPARKMSAFPSEPEHFVRWLERERPGAYGPHSFVPRGLYGNYLHAVANASRRAAPERWQHARTLAVDVRLHDDGVDVSCANGLGIRADALVVASGNASPADWPNVSPAVRASERYYASAWERDAVRPATGDEAVLVLGTGLTAIDAVFGLRENGHRGTIHMISRRGLLPHEHRTLDAPRATVPDAHTLSGLFDSVRSLARSEEAVDGNWRDVIDDLRPRTNALWAALSTSEQRRFFRHALPYWNVHRHRVAPQIAQSFAELVAAGVIRTIAGRTLDVTTRHGAFRVSVRRRGTQEESTIVADRIINCSGPQHDFRLLSNPVVQSLLAQGLMTPSPLGIGVRVAENGALIDAAGSPSRRLFTIGPARFGTLIETTAIPEIRLQACELAQVLTHERRSAVEV